MGRVNATRGVSVGSNEKSQLEAQPRSKTSLELDDEISSMNVRRAVLVANANPVVANCWTHGKWQYQSRFRLPPALNYPMSSSRFPLRGSERFQEPPFRENLSEGSVLFFECFLFFDGSGEVSTCFSVHQAAKRGPRVIAVSTAGPFAQLLPLFGIARVRCLPECKKSSNRESKWSNGTANLDGDGGCRRSCGSRPNDCPGDRQRGPGTPTAFARMSRRRMESGR